MLRKFLLVLLVAVAACQSANPPATTAPSAVATGAVTAEAARTAVARYLRGQPNAALYVPDSASVVEVATHWQVLVPRTDWAGRMPNKAVFEVDKATGSITARPVK